MVVEAVLSGSPREEKGGELEGESRRGVGDKERQSIPSIMGNKEK